MEDYGSHPDNVGRRAYWNQKLCEVIYHSHHSSPIIKIELPRWSQRHTALASHIIHNIDI